jgi:hypothetical protein
MCRLRLLGLLHRKTRCRVKRVKLGLERRLDLTRHAINEKDAVKMIVFVLDGPREKTAAAEVDGLPVFVGGADLGGFRAGDVGIDVRKAQATFGADGGGADRGDMRIDEDHGHVLSGIDCLAIHVEGGRPIFNTTNIKDGELDGVPDLLSREADAGGVSHGFEHIGDKLANFGSDLADLGAFASEDRRSVIDDGQLHRSTEATIGQAGVERRGLEVTLHWARHGVVGRVR